MSILLTYILFFLQIGALMSIYKYFYIRLRKVSKKSKLDKEIFLIYKKHAESGCLLQWTDGCYSIKISFSPFNF